MIFTMLSMMVLMLPMIRIRSGDAADENIDLANDSSDGTDDKEVAMMVPMLPMIRIRGGNIVHDIMLVLMIRIIGGNAADENIDLADYSSDVADDKD